MTDVVDVCESSQLSDNEMLKRARELLSKPTSYAAIRGAATAQ